MKDVVYCQSIAVPRIYKDREQINVQNQCTLQIKMISLVKNTSVSDYSFFNMTRGKSGGRYARAKRVYVILTIMHSIWTKI